MATKTPAEYKAAHTTGYTPQRLGFDKRRSFSMGLESQKPAESPFKAKFEPHMMYKGSDAVMAKTYEKHLELKNKGYGHKKSKSPVKQNKKLKAQIKKRKDNIGEGYMNAPYKGPKGKGPRANRKDLSYHGYTNFTSNVTGRKVHKDGKPEKIGNPTKSDAQKRVEARRKEVAAMTPAQKKAAQDKANAKRKAFENSPEYKKRKEKQMSKN